MLRVSDNTVVGCGDSGAASVRSGVERKLREQIISGELPPGTHLPDRTLCERFGVSRTIVREAIRTLEAESLVTVLPHRGPFVAALTSAEAVQIYEVRAALEALAAHCFAERASEEERAALRAVVEKLEEDGRSGQRGDLLDRKHEFYVVLSRGCRNEYAARMLGQLLNQSRRLRAMSLSAPNRLPATLRELHRIVDAIARRDGEEAALASRDHVQAAAAVALRLLRERERAADQAPPRRAARARA